CVVANVGDAETAALVAGMDRTLTFAVEGEADLVAEALTPEPFAIGFDLVVRSPSPFGRFASSSLSRREREGAPEARKAEGVDRMRVRLV
ncbi:hypothetical protein, partial [Clostridium perfringens]